MSPVSCRDGSVDSTGKIYADLGIECSCSDDAVSCQFYMEMKIKCLGLARPKLLVCSLRKNLIIFFVLQIQIQKSLVVTSF